MGCDTAGVAPRLRVANLLAGDVDIPDHRRCRLAGEAAVRRGSGPDARGAPHLPRHGRWSCSPRDQRAAAPRRTQRAAVSSWTPQGGPQRDANQARNARGSMPPARPAAEPWQPDSARRDSRNGEGGCWLGLCRSGPSTGLPRVWRRAAACGLAGRCSPVPARPATHLVIGCGCLRPQLCNARNRLA